MKKTSPYKMILGMNWMIWGVLLASQIFFLTLSLPLLNFASNLKEKTQSGLIPVFFANAFVMALVSFYFHRRAYKEVSKKQTEISTNELLKSFKSFQMNNMLSWVFSEIITILGIISLLFTNERYAILSLSLSGISLQIYYYPRIEKFFSKYPLLRSRLDESQNKPQGN